MNKKAISILLMFILLLVYPLDICATEDEFELDINVVAVNPTKIYTGETVTLTVEIANVSSDSSEKLWGAVIFIDQTLISESLLEHMTIDEPEGSPVVYDGNEHQGTEVWPGDTVYSTITFTLDNNAPGGVFQLPLVLTGKRGPCNQGCHPWREDPSYFSINIIHGIPALTISFSENNIATVGDTMMVDFSMKNLGSDDAIEIEPRIVSEYPSLVGQINIVDDVTTLAPNNTLNGTLAIFTSSVGVGEFEIELYVAYADRKGKAYEQNKSVTFSVLESSELTYEEMGDSYYSTAMEHYSNNEYKEAVLALSLSKGLFDLAGADDKSESCSQYLGSIYLELEESLTPEPVVETIGKDYYLVVGLAVGFAVTLIGLLAGFATTKKNK